MISFPRKLKDCVAEGMVPPRTVTVELFSRQQNSQTYNLQAETIIESAKDKKALPHPRCIFTLKKKGKTILRTGPRAKLLLALLFPLSVYREKKGPPKYEFLCECSNPLNVNLISITSTLYS